MGHSFTCHDIFMNFPVRKLKMTPEQCKEVYSDGSKRDLAASIWMSSVRLIIDDIIENNTQFKLPGMGRTQSYIQMKRTEGDDFKKLLDEVNGVMLISLHLISAVISYSL